MSYDKENIFAKILKGEIPCDKVFENEHVLSFKDISPKAKTHILIIPKKPLLDISDFLQTKVFKLKHIKAKTVVKRFFISIYICYRMLNYLD